ncbi:MAG: T9SS type A sorting domain-containing protein [Balneolales bacterium]|nr:T9SS type A sorting domain-containing protein [Balneolales bacterium]
MSRFLSLLLFLGLSSGLWAQTYVDRNYYGAKLEPVNGIFHGAGQDPGTNGGYNQAFFDSYAAEMDSAEFPNVYAYYESLSNIGSEWAFDLREKLLPYKDNMMIIQFGLYLVGQTGDVLSGALDEDIEDFFEGVRELGLPVLLRIGYEFNGPWNGYPAFEYIEAYRYITDKIRQRDDLEIATVWNLAAEGSTNFMDWYPGDEYVDWWSINIFLTEDFNRQLTHDYLDSAHVHQKPVLIGESTPKFVGVTDGQTDWETWFSPFFQMISEQPGIKSTGYINWDWADQTIDASWQNWGDARLESNEVVADNFRDEMDDSLYIHAGSERAFRLALGAIDSQAPSGVQGMEVVNENFPITLKWAESEDTSGISRYKIYSDGELFSYTRDTTYTFREMSAGDTLNITISVVDRAGNESALSAVTEIGLGEATEENNIIKNGDFEAGTEFWSFEIFVANASGNFTIESDSAISGTNSALIELTQTTNTNWHVQLQQLLELTPGHDYRIEYRAKADQQTLMETWVQQTAGESDFAQQTIDLTTEVQLYSDFMQVPADYNVNTNMYLRFMVGISGLSRIWIDDVKVYDLGVRTNSENQVGFPYRSQLHQNYPNPFNPSTLISYDLVRSGQVVVELYDLIGRRVSTLFDGFQTTGTHTINFDGSSLSSGIYLVRLRTNGQVFTRKITLLK